MKIYVIGKKSFLHWDDHVVDAFKSLGHNVKHFQVNSRTFFNQFSRGIIKGLLGKQKGNFLSNQMIIRSLKNEMNNFNPDLVFIPNAFFIPLEFYEMLSELKNKPKVFAWEGDGGGYHPPNELYKPFIDVLFETDKVYVSKNRLGFSNIVHLPFCSNIDKYRDLKLTKKNKIYFCGDLGIGRDEVFSKLTNYDFVIKGKNWEKLSNKSNKFEISYTKVSLEEQVKDYNSYISVLNKHQAVNHISALNMRTFEVPSTNTLLINDYREGIEDLYDLEKEILIYRNIEELIVILEKLRHSPNEFKSIASNGYKRVLNDHTYIKRMAKALTFV